MGVCSLLLYGVSEGLLLGYCLVGVICLGYIFRGDYLSLGYM